MGIIVYLIVEALMPVISFATSKGGAGKTTSAIVLGTEFAEATDVILIDADPAKRLTRWSTLARLPSRLQVVTSAGERTIQDEIAKAQRQATFVLIDLEGSASRLTSFAIAESDLVIIPSGKNNRTRMPRLKRSPRSKWRVGRVDALFPPPFFLPGRRLP